MKSKEQHDHLTKEEATRCETIGQKTPGKLGKDQRFQTIGAGDTVQKTSFSKVFVVMFIGSEEKNREGINS